MTLEATKIASPSAIYKTPAGERAVMAMYDKLLARWPIPYAAVTLSTRQGATFAIACGPTAGGGAGNEPPVILLHGAASNALAWIGDVAALGHERRVYALDLPGEPGRSSPNRPPWTGSAYTEWLEDVLVGLKVEQTALVGISQGAWVALKYATAQPQRVPRLVLLAPAGITNAKVSFLLRALPLTLLGRRGGEAVNHIVMGRKPLAEEAVAYMGVIMANFKPRVGVLPIFSDAELQRLVMPTLLVVGARDALYSSPRTAARLEALLPNLSVHMQPESGHILHGCGEEIAAFLDV